MHTGTLRSVGASVAALLIAAACSPDNSTNSATRPVPSPRFWSCSDTPPPCGQDIPGFRLTGGGRIDPAVGKTTFGFNVDGSSGPPFKGEMEVVYHGGVAPMTRIHSLEIDTFNGYTDEARGGVCGTWTGTARVSDGSERRYSATACDNGEPGSSPGTGPDRFGITVDGLGSTGVTDLTGGNIQAHK